ncbi:hypothetical protein M9Y10_015356 [Tritrichomonas musculus]|uniref:NADPH-dependent FMN reductase-like domain-containing protein n=1 Tax=Tritrichomonas musculus TaxID=1915356 RepID=A0ABR2L5B1_9EUKA
MSVRKVLAINAARKTNNTALLLKKALEGAKSEGAQTELIHLHDYNVNGCKGCMACKMLKNVPPKSCLQRDDLSPILEKCVYDADAVLVGGPIYFWQPGGIFRSFSERLLYPYFIYGAAPGKNYYPRKNQKYGIIFTMGAPKSMIDDFTATKNGKDCMDLLIGAYQGITGNAEALKVYLTYHVKKFDGYQLDCLNEPERKVYHDQTWEKDLEKAYQMGKRLAKE